MAVGMLYGGTEAKVVKGGLTFAKKTISQGFNSAKHFFTASKAVVAETKTVTKVVQTVRKTLGPAAKAFSEVTFSTSRKGPLVPAHLREWLSNVGNYRKNQIIEFADKAKLKLNYESPVGHMDFIDRHKRIRLCIHSPDKRVTSKTNYHHLHIYDHAGILWTYI